MAKNAEIRVTTLPDGKICDFIDKKIRNDTPDAGREGVDRFIGNRLHTR